MKRFLTLLLILLLFCGGTSAETVARQINAPETYQAAYYSNTGRTKITVDATVHVPDVESIPTYAVTMSSRILPLETYDFPCDSQLTIDAIDGTVIDRNYGY